MGNVLHLKLKRKEKAVPRGPRGKILLKVGQVWCRIHGSKEVIIRKLGDRNDKGKQRVWYSEKHSRGYWNEVAEMTFRMNFMEKETYRIFSIETWQKWRQEAESLGVSDAVYRLFDQPVPSELMSEVAVRRRQPVPKRGELWKSNHVGRNGPWICLVQKVMRGDEWDPGYRIRFVMRGGWGVQPCDSFRGENTRIGWLGECLSQAAA
jgi:hypothetical protein